MPPRPDPALVAAALAAAKQPLWNRPPRTDRGPVIATEQQEDLYHPRLDVVQGLLSALTPAQRQQTIQARLTWLKGRKTSTEAALTALGVSSSLPSKLAWTDIEASHWPLSTDPRVRRLWFRLRTGQRLRNTDEDTDTDQAVAALSDATVVTTAIAKPEYAAALLLQIRCLADVYARWEVGARLTSQLVGTQLASPPLTKQELLARILAYSRIEGDLSIPPEDDTLEGTDPGAGPHKIPLPPGRSRFRPALHPSAYLDCVTYLASTTKMPQASDRRGAAVRSLPVALGGLDILFNRTTQQEAEDVFPSTPPFTSTDALDWAALNRQVPPTRTHAAARAEALHDLETQLGLLTETIKGTGAQQAARIAPKGMTGYTGLFTGPGADYASLVLKEGVLYLDRLTVGQTRFGPSAPTRLPEILVYLLFHLGHEATALLASAAAHALLKRSTSSYAHGLRTALGHLDPPTRAALTAVRRAHTTPASVQEALTKWPTIAAALRPEPVLVALADYVRNESDSVWKSWAGSVLSPRSNVIGYWQVYDYLLAEIKRL